MKFKFTFICEVRMSVIFIIIGKNSMENGGSILYY